MFLCIKQIIGLGNYTLPGTRHNAGYIALNFLNERVFDSKDWSLDKKLGIWLTTPMLTKRHLKSMGCDVSQVPDDFAQRIALVKTREFMNFSGSSVKRFLKEAGLPHGNILVIHDDLERKLGALSIKQSGSANGHNGIRSIIASLKTDAFARLRLGIDRPKKASPQSVADYVLGKFAPEELSLLDTVALPKCNQAIGRYLFDHYQLGKSTESSEEPAAKKQKTLESTDVEDKNQ